MVLCCVQARKRRMSYENYLSASLPGKYSSDLLIYEEPGEFRSLLSDHPVANSVAEVHEHLNTFRMLRGCEQCDSQRVESTVTAIPKSCP